MALQIQPACATAEGRAMAAAATADWAVVTVVVALAMVALQVVVAAMVVEAMVAAKAVVRAFESAHFGATQG